MMAGLFRIVGGGHPTTSDNNNHNDQPPQQQQPAQAQQQQQAASVSRSRYTYPGQRAPMSAPPASSHHHHPPSPYVTAPTTTNVTMPSATPRMATTTTTTTTTPLSAASSSSSSSSSNTTRQPQPQHHQQQQSSNASAAAAGPQHVVLQGNSIPRATTTTTTTITTTTAPPPQPQPTAASNSPPPPSPSPNISGMMSTTSQPGTVLRPGAYQVTRTSNGPAQVYRVTVPAGVRPGAEFTVHAGPRRVRVRCPPSSRAGQALQITLPPEPIVTQHLLKMAPITAAMPLPASGTSNNDGGLAATTALAGGVGGTGGAVPMSVEVRRVNEQAEKSGGTAQTFLVTIPPNVFPGMQFTVNVTGQRFMVTCPASAGPNQKVRIVPPAKQEEPEAAPKTQVFEVSVPANVLPGQPFALVANGQRVLVTCPPDVVPGQKIRFQLPVSQVIGNISLSYDSSESTGWRRIVRATDLKFQWVRLDNNDSNKNKKQSSSDDSNAAGSGDNSNKDDDNNKSSGMKTSGGDNDNEDSGGSSNNPSGDDDKGNDDPTTSSPTNLDVDGMEQFDFARSAYVRKLTLLEGNDARMRTGKLELIPAKEAVVDSKLVIHNHTLFQYSDISMVQTQGLEEKTAWFQKVCSQLTAPWEDGHVKILIRRKLLLLDSVDAVMSLGREDMRKRWRIEFVNEPAIDAGGVAREWFTLITQQIYDPDFGLWMSSQNNQMCMNINPTCNVSCPDDYLVYFRFLGRILGRALFDRQLVKGHMVRTIYKHLLGWPITFEDIEAQDEEYYLSLKKLTSLDDVSMMCLDFTVTEESMGVHKEIELQDGGALKEVTNDNLEQYLEANLRYRMLDRTKPQLTELMLGFFDVIPEQALTVFDANELELILCGLPEIDLDDWKRNTNYSGLVEGYRTYVASGNKSSTHNNHLYRVIQWYWEIVENEFDREMRARLLQFVTGTSGVPSRGFSVLQGIDGNIKKFTIHGVNVQQYVYPRAHTCFNRIDLPNYTTKEELHNKLRAAITLSGVGFDME